MINLLRLRLVSLKEFTIILIGGTKMNDNVKAVIQELSPLLEALAADRNISKSVRTASEELLARASEPASKPERTVPRRPVIK